jgi:lysophospholipid acyltransferase
VANASGVSWNQGALDFTGAQMVLTLKLISTAMCYQDYNSKTPQVWPVQDRSKVAAGPTANLCQHIPSPCAIVTRKTCMNCC